MSPVQEILFLCLVYIIFLQNVAGVKYNRSRYLGQCKQFDNATRKTSGSYIQNKQRAGLFLPRFVQSKNFMYTLTNLFFPGETLIKPLFQTGGCPGWYLNGKTLITQDWIQTSGWSYDLQNLVIQYTGSEEDVEPKHPFPLFWLPRRMWSKNSLIKRNFFCQETQMSADIQLNGADEAGFVFRSIGDWNFWAVLLQKSGKAELIRVVKGQRKVLKDLGVHIKAGTWYSVQLQEMIADVKVKIGPVDTEPVATQWRLQDIDEIESDEQGAVGLIVSKGPAKFRNTYLGNVQWVPNLGGPGKLSMKSNERGASRQGILGMNFGNLKKLQDRLSGWCPVGSLCAGEPYSYEQRQ